MPYSPSSLSVSANLKRLSGPVDPRLEQLTARVMAATTGVAASNGQKYQLLADLIVSAIEEGVWRCGDRLPSESAFAEAIPLSLGTIQRALGLLVEQGWYSATTDRAATWPAPTAAMDACSRIFADGDVFSGRPASLPVQRILQRVSVTDSPGPWSSFVDTETRFVRLERRFNVGGSSVFIVRAICLIDASLRWQVCRPMYLFSP